MKSPATPDIWTGKTVLITGACGTVGQAMMPRLLAKGVGRIIALDNAESKIYELGQFSPALDRILPVLGDVRSRDCLLQAFRDVDVVFHGAALKHVNLGEAAPDEIVATNIVGVQNVIYAARACGVRRVVFMSSDKAVNPTNVMGTSKLMGERLISAANYGGQTKPVFCSTRFGNVLGSSGSAVPTFMNQIRTSQPITLTDEGMTRFVMTPVEAVDLLIRAAEQATGGEVFVTKMPVMAIRDMIQGIIEIYAPQLGRDPGSVTVKITGKRPGEKLFEELLSSEEGSRVRENDDFFVIRPAITATPQVKEVAKTPHAYRSDEETCMSVRDIVDYFKRYRLLD
ncbi:SDR family NAD(P)-dependent oxidoreductase [Ferrovibrio terrae]|uniref:SDR family NAD(P)-dependent oxidoreductase n=1 Tax=Ferrovibrio terrae TaxID=2594003 RepID=A0A516GXS0_9PROT|nr:SDR family NAD(P)-dependent oxidoreductase [Ferrovibrio terrae]QDO96316.1 SDR family NAD(P)-dependent oxidoreductase [Ferrovibrio terrae]